MFSLVVLSGRHEGGLASAKRRLLLWGTATAVAISIMAISAGQAAAFSDADGHWAEKYIYQMSAKGVINGYPDKSFGPDRKVSEMEAIVMVIRSLALDEAAKNTYPDLPLERRMGKVPGWGKGYLTLARSKGVILDSEISAFAPDARASRADVALYISRAALAAGMKAGQPQTDFQDAASIPGWAREAIVTVAGLGIVTGYEDNTFRPASLVTRAEIAAMLTRFDNQIANGIDRETVGTLTTTPTSATAGISILPDGGNEFASSLRDGAVLYVDTRRATFRELTKGLSGRFIVDPDGQVVFADLHSKPGGR